MNKKNNIAVGAVLIFLGIMFLLRNLNIFYFDVGRIISRFWPVFFLIIPGIIFQFAYFNGRNTDPGILVPGGILMTVGIVWQLSTTFNMWSILWPGFIFAIAVGLFELYWFGQREKALLVPIFILGGLSLIFFASFSMRELFNYNAGKLVVPVIFIVLGISIMVKSNSNNKGF